MASNTEEKILDIKVRYDDAIRAIAQYQSAVDAAKNHEKELKEELREGRISREQYNAEMAATKVVITENNEAIRSLNKEIQNNRRTEKEAEGSLKSLRAELSNLTAEYDSLSRAERNAARGKELEEKINAITDELKGAEEETKRFYRNVGNYEESIKNAIGLNNDFANSIMEIAQNSKNGNFFQGLITQVQAFGKSLLGLMTNPVFLALAGIAGAGMAFKWFYDYNKGLMEATRLTKQFTGLGGDELKAYRTEVQALADFYGKDFREMLVSANALSKQFGISQQEALDIIKDGFIAGADASGEFMDILREYPAYFKEAGISAEEFVAITSNATQQGIFSDKGIDAIKEANIRLREMTTATADALEGIGISSQEVQADLQSGATTTWEVMQQVSDKLNELPESASVVGTAIADIFGEAGEDAGLKYIRTLKDIGTNLDEVKGKAGELGRVEEELIASQTELSKEVALLFDATGGAFERFTSKVRLFVNDVLTSLVKSVRQLTESVEERGAREQNQYEQSGRENAAEQVQAEYDKIEAARKKYMEQGMSDEEALSKAREERLEVMRLTLQQEEAYLKESEEANKRYNKELEDASFWRQGLGMDRSNNAINRDIQSSWDEYMNQTAAVASQRELVRLVSEYNGGTKGNQSAIVQETEKETAAVVDAKKKQVEVIKAAQVELMNLIRNSRGDMDALEEENLQKSIENRQRLIELRLAAVKEGSDEEFKLQKEQLEAERDAELADTELTEEMKLAITKKYQKMELDLIDQHNKDIQEKQKQAIMMRYENELMQMQVDGDSDIDMLKKRANQRKEILDSINEEDYDTTTEFLNAKLNAEINYRDAVKDVDDAELEEKKKKVQTIASLTGNLSDMLAMAAGDNKKMLAASKVLAIAEVAISQGVAIANAVAKAAKTGATWVDTLAAIGSVIGAITAVMGTAMSSIQSAKFAEGGLVTGPGSGTSDSIPARLSNGESVMTAAATSMFGPILSSFNQMGGGVPINVANAGSQAVGEEMLAKAVAKGMMMAPPPVVSVEEFTSVANRVKYVENLGSV